MYSGLLIILVPLIAGYLIPLKNRPLLHIVNQLLSWMVYVILFIMGISLAFLDNLSTNLLLIFKYAAVCFLCIFVMNYAALWLLERRRPWKSEHKQEKLPSRIHMALESLKLCGVVIGGFALGLTQWHWLTFASQASEIALLFLLALVGIQLRNSSMTLRQIILNRRGMMVGMVVAVSALAGGAIAARITQESAELLGLQAGMTVLALCKATAVRVERRVADAQAPRRAGGNRLAGSVASALRGEGGDEIAVALAGGLQLVGFAPAGSGLRVRQRATATVDESAVVVAPGAEPSAWLSSASFLRPAANAGLSAVASRFAARTSRYRPTTSAACPSQSSTSRRTSGDTAAMRDGRPAGRPGAARR